MISFKIWFIGLLLALILLAAGAHAGEAFCSACAGDGEWGGSSKLDEIGNADAGKNTEAMQGLNTAQKNRVGVWKKSLTGLDDENAKSDQDKTADQSESQLKSDAKAPEKSTSIEDASSISRSENAKAMLVSIDEVSDSAVMLDISTEASIHVKGAVAIPYTEFLQKNNVGYFRSVEEISESLGKAGISRNDSVVIYGECLPCGGGPAPATLTYFVMKSLGHEKVRVLDGTVQDWSSAGKQTSNEAAIKPEKTYLAQPTDEFMASYDYVKSGSTQIVDARDAMEFGNGSITSAINIPADRMIIDGRIRDESKLEKLFAILDKTKPVVVYTGQPTKGSMAWFSMKLMGFDAKLYSYQNYIENQKALETTKTTNSTSTK